MMIQRVCLKIGKGSFSEGFPVIAQLGDLGAAPKVEAQGRLPAGESFETIFQNCRSDYYQLVMPGHARGIYMHPTQRTNVSYQDISETWVNSFNRWLETPDPAWQKIRDCLQQELNPDDEIQMIIQTDHPQLLQLPWSAWHLLTASYSRAEIALALPDYKRIQPDTSPFGEIRVLLVLGYCGPLHLNVDQQIITELQQHGAAAPQILIEPTPSELRMALRDPLGWHIFCYAGHSNSRDDGTIGELQLQADQVINLNDLKLALQKAIAQGLQLAIFNSCDGMGLARQLAGLNLPQSIVMREPIPDSVATHFLETFLQTYARGQGLYLALRETRERLREEWQHQYSGVEWFPVLTQNPATVSPSWIDLGASTHRPSCPYLGLAAFQEQDADRFFGRELVIDKLIEQLESQLLVTVLGASGSGKSSVVLAGLLPRYRLTMVERQLQVATIIPSAFPCDALSIAMLDLIGNDHQKRDRQYDQIQGAIALEQSCQTLTNRLTPVAQQRPNIRYLLIIDQFEELFTLCQDQRQRQAFLDNLIYAIHHAPELRVVITLRLDFLSEFRAHDAFNQILNTFPPELLGPMTHIELETAIRQPAIQQNVSFQPGLVKRLVTEMKDQPQRLPLLEFTLTQLWNRMEDEILTHDSYQRIGGIEKALVNYAETCFAQLDEQEHDLARRIFTQLIIPGEDNQDTRRRATSEEINSDHWPLVTQFATQRLLVTNYHPLLETETAEIIHESLIHYWPRLKLWLSEDREFRTWQEQLRGHYRLWLKTDQNSEALLSGTLLTIAEQWYEQKVDELTTKEASFIRLSQAHRDRRQRDATQSKQRTMRLRVMTIVLGLGTLMIGGVAWKQWQSTIEDQMIQRALQGNLSAAELPQLVERLSDDLDRAQKQSTEAGADQSLAEYRRIQRVTQQVNRSLQQRSVSTVPNVSESYQALEEEVTQTLLQSLIQTRLPLLKQQLQRQAWGQILDATPEKLQDQFQPGAIQTTYQLIMRESGLHSDLDNDGLLAQAEEVSLIPCEAIALIERLWRQHTENRCGWYGPHSEFENLNCPELAFTSQDIQTNPETGVSLLVQQQDGGTLLYALIPFPTDAMVDHINQCDVIAQPIPKETANVQS